MGHTVESAAAIIVCSMLLILAVEGYPGNLMAEGQNFVFEDEMLGERSKRNTKMDGITLWENGIVYYESQIPENEKQYYRMNMDFISSQTCIKFVEDPSKRFKTTLLPITAVTNESWCGLSHVGQMEDAETAVAPHCFSDYSVIHELFHLLGVTHTQHRNDWEKFVGHHDKSQKHSQDYKGIPFDYGSCMLYSNQVPVDERYSLTVQNRLKVSFYDILSINQLYCADKCPKIFCGNGGYPNPADCTKCLCPLGFSGDRCEEKGTECGGTLTATEERQFETLSFTNTSMEPRKNFFGYRYCDIWIEAPRLFNVSIEVEVLFIEWNTMLEAVVDKDVRQSGIMQDKYTYRHTYLTTEGRWLLPMRYYSEPSGPFYGKQTYGNARLVFAYNYVV